MAQGDPNLYELSGPGPAGSTNVQITFTTSDSNGKPDLVYVDGATSLNFNGDQVNVQQGPLGSLVTVFLIRTIDSGSTTLTVFIPGVNLAGTASQPIKTIAVITEDLFNITKLHTPRQTQLYTVLNLQGVAQFI